MLGVLPSVGARPNHEVYFSTPITTGEHFVQWRRHDDIDDEHPEYQERHRQHVVEKNLERVVPIVARLRQHFTDRLVIDPTQLPDVDGWAQHDYHAFWCAVVAEYASQVVFANGWQYSNGCVTEFTTAVRNGIPTLTEDLTPLPPHEGAQMVSAAVAELTRVGDEPVRLRAALAGVEQALQRLGGTT
jgi:hypothetical protein